MTQVHGFHASCICDKPGGRDAAQPSQVRGVPVATVRTCRQLQLDDTMVTLETVNVGMLERSAASRAELLDPLGLEVLGFGLVGVLGVDGLGVVLVAPLLDRPDMLLSSVPVTCTLWLTCWLRSTLDDPAFNAYDVPRPADDRLALLLESGVDDVLPLDPLPC
jgi:hypothetical protein